MNPIKRFKFIQNLYKWNFVLKSSDGASLKKMCVQRGMKTLRDSAQERFINGETTLEEALYATQAEQEDQEKEVI